MNNKLIAVVLAASFGFIVLSDSQKSEIKQITSQVKAGPSILSYDDAGNKFYLADTKQSDGGIVKRSVLPDCVRRKKGAPVDDCKRKTQDGGSVDFGQMNRFPVEQAVGSKCQQVACAVYLGQDSLKEQ